MPGMEDTLDFLLAMVGRAHHNLIRQSLERTGLHRGQPPILFALHEGDGIAHSELAARMEVTPATITTAVKRMEKAGLVVRRRDPEDERVQAWLAQGWIDVTGLRMQWWYERFQEVFSALETDQAVSRNWFDPRRPFSAGQFLAYFYSISGGQRKEYM